MKFNRLRQYFNNTLWLLAEKLLRISLNIFLLAFIARYLGQADFGILSYAVAIVALSEPIISLGLNRILVRELVRAPCEADQLVATLLILKFLVSCLCFSVVILVSVPFNIISGNVKYLLIVLSIGNLFRFADVIEFYYQSRIESRIPVIYKSVAFLISSAIKVVLVALGANVLFFAWASALEITFIALFAFYIYFRSRPIKLHFKVNFVTGIRLIQACWPEILSGLGVALCMRLDQIMLEIYRGMEAVAIYAVAVKLTDAWYFVPIAIVSSSFPALIKIMKKSDAEFKQGVQNLFLILTFMAYIVIGFVMIFGGLVIKVLFGPEYERSASVLAIYVWCLPFVALGLGSGSWIYAKDKVILAMYRVFWGVIANIIFNLIFIPIYGVHGAALATVLSFVIAYYLFDLSSKILRPVFFMKTKALFARGLVEYLRGYLPNRPLRP